MQSFTFIFTAEQANLILTKLGACPYVEVAPVIAAIQEQANQQNAARAAAAMAAQVTAENPAKTEA